MVKLQTVPDKGTIRALKGKVDFYTWKGINVARSWPRKPLLSLSPAALQAHRWLQEANFYYRGASLLVKGDLYWLTRNTTWTPRDAYMGYYFGTIPWPRPHLPAADPNPPPYPIPDPNNHYAAVQARILSVNALGNPFYTIDTTHNADWRMGVIFDSVPSHTWLTRSRYGITYPTTPHWLTAGFFPQVPVFIAGTQYTFDLLPLCDVAAPRSMYFFFYISTGTPAVVSRGHSYLMHITLEPRFSWRPLSFSFTGGPLHTDGPDLARSLTWHVSDVLYPQGIARFFPTLDAPRYPGPPLTLP